MSRISIKYILFALLLGSEVSANIFDLGEYSFETIGNSRDIPEGVITAMAQDQAGFIWVGTQRGLVRFDGYSFKLFIRIEEDITSISANYIITLWPAPDGRLYVGTMSGGLSVYDPELNSFTRYQSDEKDHRSLRQNIVRAIVGDERGGIWVGTEKGLDYLPANQHQFRHFNKEQNGLSSNRIMSLVYAQDKKLWVGTDNGVDVLDPGSDHFRLPLVDKNEKSPFAGMTMWSMTEGIDHRIWLGTRFHGAFWIRPGEKYLTFDISKNHVGNTSQQGIAAMAQPTKEEVWIGSYGDGILIFDTNLNRVVKTVQHNPVNKHSINSNEIGNILVDTSGLIWIGTWGNGLNRTNLKNRAFRSMHPDTSKENTLTDSQIHSILETKSGQVWLGTANNGIDIIDPKVGVVGGVRSVSDNTKGLPDGTIYALVQSDFNTIWIGTESTGLYRYLLDSQTFTKYTTDHGLDGKLIRALIVDDQHLWIGTDNGLNRLDLTSQSIVQILKTGTNTTPLRESIEDIVQTKDGSTWVTAVSGLYVVPENSDYLIPINPDPKVPDSLSGIAAAYLSVDSQDRVWVATQMGLDRLVEWDGSTARFESISRHFKDEKGVVFESFMFNEHGYAWNKEVMINVNTWEVSRFSQCETIDVGAVLVNSIEKTRDGILLFGGSSGLLMIDPKQYRPWNFQPPVRITSIKVNNRPINIKLNQTLTLGPNTKGFVVEFTALDYSEPKKNKYSYRLEGYDSDWIETDSEHRTANYTNLDPGNYRLFIRGSNRVGQWSPHQIALPVIQQPAWYQTIWFKIALFILFAISIYIGVRVYTWRLIEARNRLQKIVKERTAEVVAQAEQLRITNIELEKLSIVAAETDNAIVIMEESGNFEWVNKSFTRLYGLTLEQLIQTKGKNLAQASFNPKIQEAISECIDYKKSVTFEVAAKDAQGDTIWVQTTLTPVIDNTGKITKLVAIDSEFTALHKAQQLALNHAHKAGMADLAINTVHNVSNIINSASVSVDIIKDKMQDSTYQRFKKANTLLRTNLHRLDEFITQDPRGKSLIEYYLALEEGLQKEETLISKMVEQISTTITSINDIVATQQRYADNRQFFVQETYVKDVIEDALVIISDALEAKKIQIQREYDEIPMILVQRNKLLQVLIQLLNNAKEAMTTCEPDQRTITIKTIKKDQSLALIIKDTGCGIEVDQLQKIFAHGFSTKEGHKGYGLHDAANFMVEMKGSLTAESPGPKQGATFVLTLPLVSQTEPES